MKFVLNSDARTGRTVCQVQTESHNLSHPFVDTTVCSEGRVLHRRGTNYKKPLEPAEASEAGLRRLVEKKYGGVIKEVGAGVRKLEPCVAARPSPPGMQVQLLNPPSWLVAGTFALQIEVRERGTWQRAAAVSVEVTLEGGDNALAQFASRTNTPGHAEPSSPLPQFGAGGAALMGCAAGPTGEDDIRYLLRAKPPLPAPQTRMR